MGKDSKIAWTDHTFNPWWGCTKASTECKHCYADAMATRWGHDVWGADKPRRFFGDKHWNEPLKWNRLAKEAGVRHKVFCGSMMDVGEERPDLIEPRKRLWALIQETPYLDWLLLTKQPHDLARHIPVRFDGDNEPVPLPNVWVGVTVGHQDSLWRAEELMKIPAVVRFISCEPLVGHVDLFDVLPRAICSECGAAALAEGGDQAFEDCAEETIIEYPGVDWVIVGCEKVNNRPGRPMDLDWVDEIWTQCRHAGVPFFYKQGVVRNQVVETPEFAGQKWTEFPRR